MASLYAEQSVSILAPPDRVWGVLTLPEYTSSWVPAFQPIFQALESDWNMGSAVRWRTGDGTVLVDGVITGVETNEYLSFTVRDASGDFDDVVSNEDGIFFSLAASGNSTVLSVKQGDFSKIGPRAKEFHQATQASWAQTLPVIKQLAEL